MSEPTALELERQATIAREVMDRRAAALAELAHATADRIMVEDREILRRLAG